MKRYLRLGFPVVVLAALIVAGVLLVTTPWSTEEAVREAAAAPTEFSLCNISISNIPADVAVGDLEWPLPPRKIVLVAYVPILSEGLPAARPGVTPTPVLGRFGPETINEKGEWIESHLVFDPEAQEKDRAIVEAYYNPERPTDKGKLEAVINSLVVGQPNPSTPAWPRTDTPPRLDKVQMVVSEDHKGLKYRPPEAGSGLLVSDTHGSSEAQPFWQRITARTCESMLVIDVGRDGKGEIVVEKTHVVPQEQAMFDRFLSEVEDLEQ